MLINNNFDAVALKTGKHNLPHEYQYKPVDAVLAIRKRFDHWMGSILRTPVNVPETRPEIYYDGELGLRDAVRLYKRFYTEWEDNAHAWYEQIEYADLLRNPEVCLTGIANKLGWGRTSLAWKSDGPDQIPDWRRRMYLE